MNDKRNQYLTSNSQKLQKDMTKEERHLWYDYLKDLPVVFKRQKVIGRYIVDFYCASAKLVIELDGSQHYQDGNIKSDLVRDDYLRSCGFTVIRYTNTDINKHFDSVCRDIYFFVFGND